ncbi:tRNA (guanine(9)-N(1))-methyltransferase [Elasticomyces elasticus]|nr:tRNA (guanine(9)-N(1))-methyltransferase [Elasticomyces elasticus]
MESEDRPAKKQKVDHSPTTYDHEASVVGPLESSDGNDACGTAVGVAASDGRVSWTGTGNLGVDAFSGKEELVPKRTEDATGVESLHGPNGLYKRNSDEEDSVLLDVKAPVANELSQDTATPPLSKNQQKKLRRKQDWEAARDQRKVKRKEKLVEKRLRKRAAKEAEGELGEKQAGTEVNAEESQHKEHPTGRSKQLPVAIMIDCDFDALMRDNERISLAAQITRSYSDNRNSRLRAHLAVASFGGKLRDRFDTVLNKHYEGWKGVKFLEGDFVEAAEKAKEWMEDATYNTLAGPLADSVGDTPDAREKAKQEGEIVYLTSDSDDTLTRLKPYSTYIIGGLVDKNREKGICYKRAMARGVKTAKLPIGDFLDMQSRKVLATNHVNEIMLRWLELGDWGEAFMRVIPKRKGGQLKNKGGESHGDAVQDELQYAGSVAEDTPPSLNQGREQAQDAPKEDLDMDIADDRVPAT